MDPTTSTATNLWNLDVKFKGNIYSLTGKVPNEKKQDLVYFPSYLSVHMKAKLGIIPQDAFFCKFACRLSNKVERKKQNNMIHELKTYLASRNCGICVSFTNEKNPTPFTLYLVCPGSLPELGAFHRLKKYSNAKNIESLLSEKHATMIGLISKEALPKIERSISNKREERIQKSPKKHKSSPGYPGCATNKASSSLMKQRATIMQSISDVSIVSSISQTCKDPLLELHILLDQLSGSQTAISLVGQWIVDRFSSSDSQKVWQTIWKSFLAYPSSNEKINIILLCHDILRKLRGEKKAIEKHIADSPHFLVMMEYIPRIITHMEDFTDKRSALFDILNRWKKWDLPFQHLIFKVTDPSDKILDEAKDNGDVELDFVNSKDQKMENNNTSEKEKEDEEENKQLKNQNILKLIEDWKSVPLSWLGPLSQATLPELQSMQSFFEVTNQYGYYRKDLEAHFQEYIHTCHSHLLQKQTQHSSLSLTFSKYKKHDPEKKWIIHEAFCIVWNILDDADAAEIIFSEPTIVISETWKKLMKRYQNGHSSFKVQNPAGFVLSAIKNTRGSMDIAQLNLPARMQEFAHQLASTFQTRDACSQAIRATWSLDEGAIHALQKVSDLQPVAEQLLDVTKREVAARTHAHHSVHVMKIVRKLTLSSGHHRSSMSDAAGSKVQAVMKKNTNQWWSPKMRFLIDQALGKKKLTKPRTSSGMNSHTSSANSSQSSVSKKKAFAREAQMLEEIRQRIPDPPPLKFKRCKLKDIFRQEENPGGKIGVGPSGIPDAGNGLFNISGKTWPMLTVVCIFGSRRITKEMHHDGLNKVARCGELGETFVVVNGQVQSVEDFQVRYGHRLVPYDGLVDAEDQVGGYPNDRVYEYPPDIYWDASGLHNNSILTPGCIIDPNPTGAAIVLDQLYVVTWKDVSDREEFFLAYGTSYYDEDGENP